jgi:hypothetical protein
MATIELNEETVLAAVNELHARTGKRVITPIEIAEELGDHRVKPRQVNRGDVLLLVPQRTEPVPILFGPVVPSWRCAAAVAPP